MYEPGVSRNQRRRRRKAQSIEARKRRQEEAKVLSKVTLRSWKSAESSMIKLFKRMAAMTPKASVPLELPKALRDSIHPNLRDEADKFWRKLIAGLLHARAESNDTNSSG